MKLVKVTWADSCTVEDQWKDATQADYKYGVCTSVGYVVKDTKDVIVIAPHIFPHKGTTFVCGEMVIPKCTILKIREL